MPGSTVLVQSLSGDPAIALVTLNRPDALNAINTELAARLDEVFEDLGNQRRVRVVAITGAGPRAFSAGGDLKERNAMTRDQWRNQHRVIERAFARIRHFHKPLFAAVNGAAVGGGCELAMTCDFIIAAQHARFGQPEVKRGIMPGGGGTQLLPRFVPRGMALELLMTGRLLAADEAYRLGLVNQVVPPDRLMEEAERVARAIAANSPAAVQQAKKSVKLGESVATESAIALELECYQLMVDHPDRYEGVLAFNEGREPRFIDAD